MNFQKIREEYEKNGCCKIENFLSPEELEDLSNGIQDCIDHMTNDVHVHSAYSNPKTKEDEEYYLSSSDKIAYFFENDAFDKDGNLTVDKKKALCKIGYGAHWWNPNFKRISFSQKVKDLLKAFDYKDPVIVQSMVIFKHPKIGEIVNPHQDSTFLYTEPLSCIGLWFPLEDATIENGCLWYVPGSHKDEIHKRFVRRPDRIPMMELQGKNPDKYESKYVPAPAKKGDCVLIHGSVMHQSGRNTTDKSRVVYTYHIVENDAKWSKENWLQPSERLPFPSVYAN